MLVGLRYVQIFNLFLLLLSANTRVMGLSCGVVCVILCLALLIQYRSVTDRHTDTQTDT